LTNTAGATTRVLAVGRYTAPAAFRPKRPRHVRFQRRGATAVISWAPVAGARQYRVKVTGSDGRIKTFFAKAGTRNETLANVIPKESFHAAVTALGGANMLPSPAAKVSLKAMKGKRPPRGRPSHKKRATKRKRH
jgi:hypothetical protein